MGEPCRDLAALDDTAVSNGSHEPCRVCETFHADDVCPGWSIDAWKHVGLYYRDHADPLRRYVRRVAADRGLSESLIDVDSVVHEAFLAMYISYGDIVSPRAWLFVVARRLVGKIASQDQRRRADGDPHTLLDTGRAQWSSLTPSADPADLHDTRRVVEAMRMLPENQKVAVYLRHVQGWSTAEISDYLGCAPATVSVHIHRGISHLSRLIAAFIGLISITAATLLALLAESSTTPSVRPGGPPPPPKPEPPLPSAEPFGWIDLVQIMAIGLLVAVTFSVSVLCVLMIANAVWHAVRTPRGSDSARDTSDENTTNEHHRPDHDSWLTLFPRSKTPAGPGYGSGDVHHDPGVSRPPSW